ncbi:hypothetical protein BDC45DRAFT_525772 [Circinella umbellata]|nr:hypothetical protein BDC45DRAFT_525772 [Circinella umbellata]
MQQGVCKCAVMCMNLFYYYYCYVAFLSTFYPYSLLYITFVPLSPKKEKEKHFSFLSNRFLPPLS